MTIIALLGHSLANLRHKSASLKQQKDLPSRQRSYGSWATLIAARMEEAELLASVYVPRSDNTTIGEPVRQPNGWVFHR